MPAYEEFLEIFSGDAATRQITDVEDVAAVAVLLLASDAGSGISGSLISVDTAAPPPTGELQCGSSSTTGAAFQATGGGPKSDGTESVSQPGRTALRPIPKRRH